MTEPRNKKKTTIYDIAKHCRVSPATVSRVLSGSDYPVSDDVRQRVQQAAKTLHYVPNLLGKNLKTAQNNDIGVVIPNMSSYYMTLLQAIQNVARQHGSQIILCNSYRDARIEERNVNLLLQKQVKGILIATIDDSGAVVQEIIDKQVPVVAMEQDVKASCNRTNFNFEAGARLAVAHLIGLGHRHIAFVSAPLLRMSRRKLLAGYKSALRAHNLEIVEQYIYVESYEKDDDELYDYTLGRHAVDFFLALETPPTAIFCINDMAAIGVIKQLQSQGVAVPAQVSVVGFDNIPFTEMMTPSITTIDQSTYDLGYLSADLLFKNIATEDDTGHDTGHDTGQRQPSAIVSLQLEPKLVVRDSTAAVMTMPA